MNSVFNNTSAAADDKFNSISIRHTRHQSNTNISQIYISFNISLQRVFGFEYDP